jgi:D-3-phosphoglycerate dehydrogenase / 2-oxoglutarate reductase
MKVLVTCPPMLKGIHAFRSIFERNNIELITPDVVQTLSEEELIMIVPEVDGWIIGDDPATEKVFAAGKAGKLKAVVKWGVGIDNVDFKAAQALELPISNTPQMFGNEVADVAISYLTGLARQTFLIDREVRKGNWIKPPGVSLTGKTVALVGLGDIGRATAKRLKGFDMKINGYDPYTSLSAEELGVDQIIPFPENLADVDFVILTCALTPSSKHLINAKTIELMKDGVYIINVSRGGLVNENDLTEALLSGKIKAAALDVFEYEPLPLTSRLREFDQCIFGTHNGSNTTEAVKRASEKAINLLFSYLNIN